MKRFFNRGKGKSDGGASGDGIIKQWITTVIVEKSEETSRSIVKFLALVLGRERVEGFAETNKGLEKWVPYFKDVLVLKFGFAGKRAEFIITDFLSEFNDRLKSVREKKFDFGPAGSGSIPDFIKTDGAKAIALALIEINKYPALVDLMNGLKKNDKVKFLHHFEGIPAKSIPNYVKALAELNDKAFKSHVDTIEAKKADILSGAGETLWKKIKTLHKKDAVINGEKRTGAEAAFMGLNFAKSLFS